MLRFRERRRIERGERKALLFRSDDPDIKPAPWMFSQDVVAGFIPYRSRGQSGFEIIWHGEQEQREKALYILQSIAGDYQFGDEATLDAIRNVGQEIAWSGKAWFEILQHDGNFDVLAFTSSNVFSCGPFVFQFVPRRLWKELGRKINILSAGRVWTVSIPAELGGWRAYSKVLRSLGMTGPGIMPSFYNEDLRRSRRSVFELQKYRFEIEAFEAKATRMWGWNRRDFSGRNWTEYALFHRIMKFRYAQAVLREHIVREFNRLFKRLGIDASFVIFGLSTPNEVAADHVRMSSGEISFARAALRSNASHE